MAPSNKDKAKEEKEKLIKKLKNQKQTTIFGIPNYRVTQKKMKKVGKNQWKEVAKFVRVEESCSVENSTAGLFQHMCDCMRQFRTTQGLGAHKLSCNVAIAKREKDDNERMEEIKATHDRTVFSICNDKTPLVSGAGGGGSITHARETRRNNDRVIMRSSRSRERS